MKLYDYLTSQKIPEILLSTFQKYVEKYKNFLHDNIENNESDKINIINPYKEKINTADDKLKKEKRLRFRKLANDSYTIENDWLHYKYKIYKDKYVDKLIPYKNEVPYILYSGHINNNIHECFKKSKSRILESKYYYEGITTDLLKYINNCIVCKAHCNLKLVDIPERVIIDNGPHYQYCIDLFHLPTEIGSSTGVNYIVKIIDHFSKWSWSYPLKKTSNELLNKLKTYCYSFGIPKIILTNNGTEVKNKEIENFCNVNAIFHQFSPPYDPKVNGAVEALH